jgi:hypothetical protein
VLFSPVRTIRQMPAPQGPTDSPPEVTAEALDETTRPVGLSPRATMEDDLEADRA